MIGLLYECADTAQSFLAGGDTLLARADLDLTMGGTEELRLAVCLPVPKPRPILAILPWIPSRAKTSLALIKSIVLLLTGMFWFYVSFWMRLVDLAKWLFLFERERDREPLDLEWLEWEAERMLPIEFAAHLSRKSSSKSSWSPNFSESFSYISWSRYTFNSSVIEA